MVKNCSLRIAPGLSGLVLLFVKILLEESCLKALLLALSCRRCFMQFNNSIYFN